MGECIVFVLLVTFVNGCVELMYGEISGGEFIRFLGIAGIFGVVFGAIGKVLGSFFCWLSDVEPYRNMGRYTPANSKRNHNHWYGKK